MENHKIFAIVFILLGVYVTVCQASLEKTHRVWGNAGDVTYINPPPSTSPPVSGSASDGGSYAYSVANEWGVYAYRYGFANIANAYAENTYIFSPISDTLTLTVSGVITEWWFENDAKLTLIDQTTGTILESYLSPSYTCVCPFLPGEDDMQPYQFSWTKDYEVNPLHEYKLTIFVAAHRSEGGDGSAELIVNSLIPEPASLLFLGLGGLLCRKIRFYSK